MTVEITEALLTTAPDPSHGTRSGYGDWRFVVEILGPNDPGAVIGNAIIGTDPVSYDRWLDITSYVRGVEITRGAASIGEPPDVGTAIVQLTSDAHHFDPWRSDRDSFHGMGDRFRTPTPIRIGWVDPIADEWRPAFTGVPERWTSIEVADDADAYVEIELQEPLALAARIPITYGPTEIGADPNGTRNSINALPTIFEGFEFPYVDRALVGDRTIAGLTFEDTLLGFARTLGVAASSWIMTGRDGVIAQYRTPAREEAITETYVVPDPHPAPVVTISDTDLPRGALRVRHDPEGIINSVTFRSPNAVLADDQVRNVIDQASIDRYGERNLDITNEWNAYITGAPEIFFVLAFAFADTQVDALELGPGDEHFDHCTDIDVRSAIDIAHAPRTSPVEVTLSGYVRQLTTRVQITADRTFVRSTITPDIYETTTTEVAP